MPKPSVWPLERYTKVRLAAGNLIVRSARCGVALAFRRVTSGCCQDTERNAEDIFFVCDLEVERGRALVAIRVEGQTGAEALGLTCGCGRYSKLCSAQNEVLGYVTLSLDWCRHEEVRMRGTRCDGEKRASTK